MRKEYFQVPGSLKPEFCTRVLCSFPHVMRSCSDGSAEMFPLAIHTVNVEMLQHEVFSWPSLPGLIELEFISLRAWFRVC